MPSQLRSARNEKCLPDISTSDGISNRWRSRRPSLLHTQKKPVSPQRDLKPNENQPKQSIAAIVPIVLPLLLVYISNQWSRSSLYYLVNFSNSDASTAFTAMNLDIGFSEAQYGALASVAFTALFAVASLFAGGLADRNDRKLLTIGSIVAWSAATFVTAISGDYTQVLIARIFMGLACAFCTPSAYTLIRDLVSKERASLANSLYGSGVYLGGGLSSLSILLDGRIGWRGTLEVIAAFGLVAAATAATFLPSDPNIGAAAVAQKNDATAIASKTSIGDKSSAFTDVKQILSIPRVQWLFAGSFLRFCSGLCIGVWAAPYYKLAFPDDATSYAVINAGIVGLCGVTSSVIGGIAADKTATWAAASGKDANAGRLVVPIIGSLLAVPAWYLTSHASTFGTAMTWLAIEYLVAECWFGPTVAVLQSEVGKSQGGTAQGLFTLTGAIGNFAPSLLGILYGQQASVAGAMKSSDILSTLLANGVCAGYLLSAACFVVSATKDAGEKKVPL
jgi:MFS family permease